MKSSHPLPRRRQPPVFSCYLSVRWVRKEGAVCIATSYAQAAQLLYPPKRSGEGQAEFASLWLTPPRAARRETLGTASSVRTS